MALITLIPEIMVTMAIVQKKYFPRENLKITCRKVTLNMFWHFWKFWLNLQWSVGPWIYPYLVFLIPFLVGIKSLHQRQADNTNMKKEIKWVVQNQDSELQPHELLLVLKQVRALSLSIHCLISLDVCTDRLRSFIHNLFQRTQVPRSHPV